MLDKVWLQTWLWPKTITSFNKINMTKYFENLIVELHGIYVLNIFVKFHAN